MVGRSILARTESAIFTIYACCLAHDFIYAGCLRLDGL